MRATRPAAVAGRSRPAARVPRARRVAPPARGAPPPVPRVRVRPARAAVPGSRSLSGEIALEQMRGGTRIRILGSPGALGEPRGEALVVQIHRYRQSPLERFGKRTRAGGLLPLLAA